MLGAALVDAGLYPRISVGPYNQIIQACLDHGAHFGFDPDVVVLLWRIEDILLSEFSRFILGDGTALDEARDKMDELARAVAHLRNAFRGTILVSLPAFPLGVPADLLDLDGPRNGGYFHRSILEHADKVLSGIRQVKLIDVNALQRDFGARAMFEERKWYLYRQPYAEAFLWEFGCLIARIVKAGRVAPYKCVVVDCDNTLWGGIVGEDGVDGLTLGEDFPGSAYRDLQRLILYWRSQGVMLAIASQNNERDVWEVFDRHDGMLLKKDDFSAWAINWEPKPLKLQQIAAALNIGIDSLVFLDDNPFEIEQVKQALPEVEAVLLDDEPARMVSALKSLHLFDKLDVTEEDAKRSEMMRTERARAALGENLTKEKFTAALGLKVRLERTTPHQLARVAQLVNKTNQFNLTTMRRTAEEVEALAASPDWRVYALRVCDKFGDYGLVGVAIIEILPAAVCRVDTLLLSCRVLGRGVETAFLAGIAAGARTLGGSELRAAFIPTRKNAPAADFLPAHGFQRIDTHVWTTRLAAVPPTPGYIDLQMTLGE
jgi:FkbH-like protein